MAAEISPEQREEYREAFNLFDKDKSGSISRAELKEVMHSLGQNPSDTDIADMMREVDVDGTDSIEFEEFLAMMARKNKDSNYDDEIRNAFKVFDKDGNGVITKSELKQIMDKLGEKLNSDEIDAMMKEADKDGDGTINYEEFVAMMQRA